jgi:hypothetical protein
MIKLILVIAAIVFFLLDGFRVPAKVSWTPFGFACVTAAVLLPL